MKLYKLFSGLCLASAFIAACGQDSFPVGLLGVLCVCSVICGLTGWYMNFDKMRELKRKTKENAETFHSIADSQKPDPKYLQPLARKITVMESVR